MKMFLINKILVFIFSISLAFAFNNNRTTLKSENLSDDPLEKNDSMIVDESTVRLLLYTLNGDEGRIITSNNIKNTSFNEKNLVKFTIHGFRGSPNTSQWIYLEKQLLKNSEMNVIAVDWSELADTWNYPLAISRSKKVAVIVGEFIISLINDMNVSLSQVHVLGHSLGGHLAGFVGKYIFAQTGNKLSRISGLDPAGPLYENPHLVEPSKRLTSDDAEFVDIIHTNREVNGFSAPLGHVDFYPNNGGPIQPGCGNMLDGNGCSHCRCLDYYAESINNDNFISLKCDSWEKFRSGECQSNTTVVANLGYHVNSSSTGVFYLFTNEESPFAIGS